MTQQGISIDKLIRRSGHSITMHIEDDGSLVVRAPTYMPTFLIKQFVSSHSAWIIKNRRMVAARPVSRTPTYQEGESFRIGGRTYILHRTKGNAIVLAGDKLFFPERFVSKASYHMESWLRTWAKKFLTSRLNAYAAKMGVAYKKITIRDTSSRWGSCSSSGTLSFSYRLVLADISIIDYVLIHELAHVTHHNHKAVFWNRVAQFYPEYESARAWLTREGHTLRI